MKKLNIAFVSVVVLMLVVGGLFVYLNMQKPAERTTIPGKAYITLNVGSIPVAEAALLEIAKQNDYFKEEGLSVNIVYAKSTKFLLPALANKEIDISAASISAGSFNFLAKDPEIKIIAEMAKRKPGIIVRSDLTNEINSINDLKGRKVVTPRMGSASYYFFARILQNSDLKIDDLEMMSLKQQEALTALGTKDIEAGIINEPYGTLAVKKGLGVFMKDSRINNAFPEQGTQHSFLIATKELAENKDVLNRFKRAYAKAAVFYKQAKAGDENKKARIAEIISSYTGIDKEVVKDSRWFYVSNNAEPDIGQLEEIQSYWLENDLIDNKIDLISTVV